MSKEYKRLYSVYGLISIKSTFISLGVWVCVVSVLAGQPLLQLTHPYKAGREPSFLLINLAPPPIFVGSVQHLNDVASLKCQLPVCHGHMIPYRLSVDDRTSTYQLEKLECKTQAMSYPHYMNPRLWKSH